MLYNRLKQPDKALADYSKSIEFNAKFADAYYNRGLTYYQLKNPTKAIADLEKAAQLFKSQGKGVNAQKAQDTLDAMKQASDAKS